MAMPHLDSQQTGRTLTLESFAEAYIKGFRLTVRFLLSKGATPDQAEETAQTAWARGWEARSQLQLENRVLAWVNTIAYHRLCEGYRYTVENVELTDIADPKSGSEATRFDAAILLNRCSALDRPLMEQRYIEGMGMKEIAARMGLSEIAVRVRIHRCQHRLRSSIRREEETRPSPDLFLGDRFGAGRGASS
jgi:RNA polymerase sigma factor (sigma-70 family)